MENNPYNKPKPATKERKLPKKVEPISEETQAIRAAVLSLGGDEDDFKMINDVDSDSEVEGEVELKAKGKKSKDVVDVSNYTASRTYADVKTQATLSKDLKDLFKSLDFAAAGGATLESESEEEETVEGEEADDQEESESESEDEVVEEIVPVPVVEAVKASKAKVEKVEKVESKREREDRRTEERNIEKEKEKVEKAIIREEKSNVVLPNKKSPWVSHFHFS